MIFKKKINPKVISLIKGGEALNRFFESMEREVSHNYTFVNHTLYESSHYKQRNLQFTINVEIINDLKGDLYSYHYGSFDVKFEKIISIENYENFKWDRSRVRAIAFDQAKIKYKLSNEDALKDRTYGISLETVKSTFINHWIKIEAVQLEVSNFKINPALELDVESGKYRRKQFSTLTIVPLTPKTAKLIKVTGPNNQNNTFINFGDYEGWNKYDTQEKLMISHGEYEGKRYLITEIQECTFSHCSKIKEIFIGKHVTKIKWNMYNCSSLLDIKVDKSNPVYQDKDGVLFKGNELIGFPPGRTGEYIIPEDTLKIGNTAFKSSQISSIILPEGLEEIGCNAFYECKKLKEIVLPLSIKKVKFNNNVDCKPIQQKFYLHGDKLKKRPYSIDEITKMYPEK